MAERKSVEETKVALHDVVREMYDRIVKGDPPTMTLPVRTKNNIGFEKKIIVFEDLDCMSDIILERKREKHDDQNKKRQNTNSESNSVSKDELLKTIKEGMNPDNCKSDFVSYLEKNANFQSSIISMDAQLTHIITIFSYYLKQV